MWVDILRLVIEIDEVECDRNRLPPGDVEEAAERSSRAVVEAE